MIVNNNLDVSNNISVNNILYLSKTLPYNIIGDLNISGSISATLSNYDFTNAVIKNSSIYDSNIFGNFTISGNIILTKDISFNIGSNNTRMNNIYSKNFIGDLSGNANTCSLASNLVKNLDMSFNNLDVSGRALITGHTTSSYFISTIEQGTPPFVVTSSTEVTNLRSQFASNASNATYAVNAVNATNAINATDAVNAVNATNAINATDASYAITATTGDNSNKIANTSFVQNATSWLREGINWPPQNGYNYTNVPNTLRFYASGNLGRSTTIISGADDQKKRPQIDLTAGITDGYNGSVNMSNSNLTVDGTINGTTIGTGSDDRIKYNKAILDNGLAIIRKLTPKKYQKTNVMLEADYYGDLSGYNWHYESGFIAQELLTIDELKYCVTGGDSIDENDVKIPKMYYVNYNDIFTHNVVATQELDRIVQEEQRKNVNLENTVNTLQSKVTNLENTLNNLLRDIIKG